jgi:electron transfer flavoprotein beta subunit
VKIIVALKEVPARDSTARVAENQRWIEEDDLAYEVNEPDAYALEAALVLKERHGGEVVVLCAGPDRAATSIREALAKGADRAIHIVCDDIRELDALTLARRLGAAASSERPDLVLTGLQSDDLGFGQTGVLMAETIGIPHATIVMEVESSGNRIRVKRELESGWFQWVELPLPALVTIQSGISKLRYATLMGIKKAKTKEIRRLAAAELPCPAAASLSLERVYLPPRKSSARMITGSPDEIAAQLTEVLRIEARVL